MTTDTGAVEALSQEELVHAIQAATGEVFTTMLNLSVTPGEVFVEKEEAVPSSGVVSLIGRHEMAYLEHCRRFATQKPV